MEGTKEADLITAVLMYAIRCLAEGDHAALRSMNFGPHEIEALRQLSLADLYRVESLRAHCLEIALNREVYWPMIDRLQSQRQSEEWQQALIAADAPLEMMQTLFGVGAREYTRLRRVLTVEPAVGRPTEPDEATSHRLWAAWKSRIDARMPRCCLRRPTSNSTVKPISHCVRVWNLTQRWTQYGDLTGKQDDA